MDAAEARARSLIELAGLADRALAEARLQRLSALRAEIAMHHERIEGAYAAMVEAMAAVAIQLVQVARDADFSIPPWPDDIRTAFELKLVETREMTIRIATDTPPRASLTRSSRIAAIEDEKRR